VNKKGGRIWKDLVLVTFTWRVKKSHEKYRQSDRSLSCTFKAGIPVYEGTIVFHPELSHRPFIMDTKNRFSVTDGKKYT
jgi:hypothetical protein